MYGIEVRDFDNLNNFGYETPKELRNNNNQAFTINFNTCY